MSSHIKYSFHRKFLFLSNNVNERPVHVLEKLIYHIIESDVQIIVSLNRNVDLTNGFSLEACISTCFCDIGQQEEDEQFVEHLFLCKKQVSGTQWHVETLLTLLTRVILSLISTLILYSLLTAEQDKQIQCQHLNTHVPYLSIKYVHCRAYSGRLLFSSAKGSSNGHLCQRILLSKIAR